ncbi:SubName: Full=Uncharacterized protein {ECO:0000313/EMBL:CCA71845.1} [Serendipita indica DSM 11827]|uniref:Uncharacterized protein n=1 Tax=Serendipita indica (strain DSM 11827) TaxID=1109443 RepID=G4TKK2_SERID|nr:SubName: Full=Uncharacterized protein {ECO:0000313/EMBL:CCA71845.1} [Serendipita indica DSM 11827]CCA71845.1 hypothetical protein PIIN_05780 [Serendipita indica DSM 11827]
MIPLHFTTLLLVGLAQLDIVAAQKGCGKAQESAVKNMRFRISYTSSTMDTIAVSAWSGGGGPRRAIPSNAASGPFSGREYGGGDRHTIYGTRAYGSGYPYGADNANSVAGRPFPYGVWPISWGPSYLGGGEYFSASSSNNGGDLDLDFLRPGGPVGVVKLAPDTSHWNGVDANEVYEMIGDRESLMFMMADLVDWCHAQPQLIRRFNPSAASNNTQPQPENVLQYYRASSFAIAYSGYNNTFALGSSNPTTSQSFADSSPLPSQIANSAFLQCINSTIANALPIADSVDTKEKGITSGAIIGIVFGSFVGSLLIYLIGTLAWASIAEWRENRAESIPMVDQETIERIVQEVIQEENDQHGKKEDENEDTASSTHKKAENTVYV